MGVELPLRLVLEDPTVGSLSRLVEKSRSGTPLASPGAATEDLERDCALPPEIAPAGAPGSGVGRTSFFVTGATGFLGAYLVHELLTTTEGTITAMFGRAARTRLSLDCGTTSSSTSYGAIRSRHGSCPFRET